MKTPLIGLVLAALALCGCSGDTGPTGPQGEPAELITYTGTLSGWNNAPLHRLEVSVPELQQDPPPVLDILLSTDGDVWNPPEAFEVWVGVKYADGLVVFGNGTDGMAYRITVILLAE